MYRIDPETVQKILDTVDIVEVVSDFVNLRKRGANYIGLCPFHNERTPSFSVSKSKGLCKCFSCGKGGTAVTFIMEHENLSYAEALRYLAKKYNIEIKEKELTDAERIAASEREALFAVNDFALLQFENNMQATPEGRNIGLAYFRERGINEAMVSRFHLGYALDKKDALLNEAVKAGYRTDNLLKAGLVSATESGQLIDRFRGRVIYPVFTISGKVVAFGGRILSNEKKNVGKYVNSPESVIYSKSRELYGLYQARKSIVKEDKCFLVEGYMDVISMAQIGIENVVASSGTSLTEGQIRLIHRFTENVTVIYDSDNAGIKASLRGIDMLLSEGMNIKVLQLPDGEDPDSFAQSHSLSEVTDYISAHERDFISFKIDILLKGAERDPIRRAQVTSDIVKSIASIPDIIKRNAYIMECSYALSVSDAILTHEVNKAIRNLADQKFRQRKIEEGRAEQPAEETAAVLPPEEPVAARTIDVSAFDRTRQAVMRPYEENILRLLIRYGMLPIGDYEGNSEDPDYRVAEYIFDELAADDITFANDDFRLVLEKIYSLTATFKEAYSGFVKENNLKKTEQWEQGIVKIQQEADSLSSIKFLESKLKEECEREYLRRDEEFLREFITRPMIYSEDDTIRNISMNLVTEKYTLSKIHTKYTRVESEKDLLFRLVPRAIYDLKNAILEQKISGLKAEIIAAADNPELQLELLARHARMIALAKDFARLMGDRVLAPRRK